ncbi:hypothetical protein D3C80_1594850 [compost metagenome]
MIRPDFLRGHGGETDIILNGALVPRFADAIAAHVADFHVHHHLRRRHDHIADIVKRMDPGVRQPVIEPHGVGAGGESLGKGVRAFRTGIDRFFHRVRPGDAGLFQLI